MQTRLLFLLFTLFLAFASCQNAGEEKAGADIPEPAGEMKFDEAKWKTKDGEDYPFRDKMLNDVIYNDTLRALRKGAILDVLGEPDRTNDDYLYYTISRKRLGFWTLHAKTMVIKFSGDDTIEWIKIHE